MTACIQCKQVVVFSKQSQHMTFCCKECMDEYMRIANQKWHLAHHYSQLPPAKLKDVMFHNQPPDRKKTGMFGDV